MLMRDRTVSKANSKRTSSPLTILLPLRDSTVRALVTLRRTSAFYDRETSQPQWRWDAAFCDRETSYRASRADSLAGPDTLWLFAALCQSYVTKICTIISLFIIILSIIIFSILQIVRYWDMYDFQSGHKLRIGTTWEMATAVHWQSRNVIQDQWHCSFREWQALSCMRFQHVNKRITRKTHNQPYWWSSVWLAHSM